MVRSKEVDVDIDFDGGDNTKDGIFKLHVEYSLAHCCGDDGVEKGTLELERKLVGDLWTTILKTTAPPHHGGSPAFGAIIPLAVSNWEMKLESDRETKLNANYVHPAIDIDMHFHAAIDKDEHFPGESWKIEVVNGKTKHDLTKCVLL